MKNGNLICFYPLSLFAFLKFIKRHIMARFIDISAMLKTGKFIGINSIKSYTKPTLNRSIPLPIVPPSIKENPTPCQNLIRFDVQIHTINVIATVRLKMLRKVVLLLSKLNAAPVFLTNVRFIVLLISTTDFPDRRLLWAQNLVAWSKKTTKKDKEYICCRFNKYFFILEPATF